MKTVSVVFLVLLSLLFGACSPNRGTSAPPVATVSEKPAGDTAAPLKVRLVSEQKFDSTSHHVDGFIYDSKNNIYIRSFENNLNLGNNINGEKGIITNENKTYIIPRNEEIIYFEKDFFISKRENSMGKTIIRKYFITKDSLIHKHNITINSIHIKVDFAPRTNLMIISDDDYIGKTGFSFYNIENFNNIKNYLPYEGNTFQKYKIFDKNNITMLTTFHNYSLKILYYNSIENSFTTKEIKDLLLPDESYSDLYLESNNLVLYYNKKFENYVENYLKSLNNNKWKIKFTGLPLIWEMKSVLFDTAQHTMAVVSTTLDPTMANSQLIEQQPCKLTTYNVENGIEKWSINFLTNPNLLKNSIPLLSVKDRIRASIIYFDYLENGNILCIYGIRNNLRNIEKENINIKKNIIIYEKVKFCIINNAGKVVYNNYLPNNKYVYIRSKVSSQFITLFTDKGIFTYEMVYTE